MGWILILPYEGYNKRTYISENALLPGQVPKNKNKIETSRLLTSFQKKANLDYGFNDIHTAEEYRDKIVSIQEEDSET